MLSHFSDPDRVFAIALIVIYVWLTTIRFYFRSRSGDLRRPLFNRAEGIGNVLFRWIVGSALLFAMALYFAVPETPEVAYVPIPLWLRWTGVAVAALTVSLIWWSHATLKEAFSTTLRVAEGQRLITSGPYRYIAHPIYTGFFTLFAATFLFSRNWIIGFLGAMVIGSLMTTRLAREERMMHDSFGTDYAAYLQKTGRFLPRLRKTARKNARKE